MYLENLLEFADIIGTTLSFTEAGPQATANTLKYLTTIGQNHAFLENKFGNYLCKDSFLFLYDKYFFSLLLTIETSLFIKRCLLSFEGK